MKLHLIPLSLLASATLVQAEDWPQWRGINRDGHSPEKGLVKEWPAGGPKVAWKIENVGVGYSSMAIVDGRIFTMGDLDGVEHILAFSEKDGSLLWAVQPEPVAAKLDGKVSAEFAQHDKNKDGKLDELEAMNGLGQRALTADGPGEGDPAQIAATRTANLLALFDKDQDGAIGMAELPPALASDMQRLDMAERGNSEAIATARAQAMLAAFDKNKDGAISREESRGTIVNTVAGRADQAPPGERRGDDTLTTEELTAYFGKGERGRDGIVTKAELERYLSTVQAGRDGILTQADLKRSIGGYRNGQGDGPRGTPAVVGDKVYTEGGNGDVTCLDAATGKTIWHVNLVEDFGGSRPGWGYSESPLLVNGMVVVTPGGKNGTVVALKADTGKLVWRANGITEGAHYASAITAEIGGTPQIVQFAGNSVFGVNQNNGEFLWKYSGAANGTANCTTPIVDGNYVLASSAYGTGSGLAKISPNPETGFKADQVYFEKGLQNHHGGIVKVGDYVYGFSSSSLICMNFMTGKIAWEDKSVKKGSLIFADGMLYCLGEGQEVALVEATAEKYVEKGRFRVESHGRPSWAHPVIANGKFYSRDQHVLTAYEVK